MHIETFQPAQADAVASLIRRNLVEIISRYYSPDYVAYLIDCHTPAQLLENARTQHIFVALDGGEVVGTGALANYGSAEAPSYYGTAIFVAPERQGQGVGRALMDAVETRAAALSADRLTVRAAVNARGFYQKLGYQFRDEKQLPDERGNYVMDKVLNPH